MPLRAPSRATATTGQAVWFGLAVLRHGPGGGTRPQRRGTRPSRPGRAGRGPGCRASPERYRRCPTPPDPGVSPAVWVPPPRRADRGRRLRLADPVRRIRGALRRWVTVPRGLAVRGGRLSRHPHRDSGRVGDPDADAITDGRARRQAPGGPAGGHGPDSVRVRVELARRERLASMRRSCRRHLADGHRRAGGRERVHLGGGGRLGGAHWGVSTAVGSRLPTTTARRGWRLRPTPRRASSWRVRRQAARWRGRSQQPGPRRRRPMRSGWRSTAGCSQRPVP